MTKTLEEIVRRLGEVDQTLRETLRPLAQQVIELTTALEVVTSDLAQNTTAIERLAHISQDVFEELQRVMQIHRSHESTIERLQLRIAALELDGACRFPDKSDA